MKSPTRVIVAIACGVLAAAGCSADDTADAGRDEPSTAFQLAVIDGENPTGNDDLVVDRYQAALDEATAKCTQDEGTVGDVPGVGDLAVRMAQRQPETWTVLEALRGIATSIPDDLGIEMDCIEISAALLTLSG